MGKFCSAYGCSNSNVKERKKDGVSFFGFPHKKPDVLKSWVARLKREGFKPTQHSHVCSEHFQESDFKYQPFTGKSKS